MRSVKKIHKAINAPIADLVTFRALPNNSIQHIDPFLFLNHHGHQLYPQNNNGLPFGPHPHRGFETVTFILQGDLAHKDSSGAKSIINAGGVQWMTAGRGLIHAEVSSDKFMRVGGDLEILQLWVNLPAKHKMVSPVYVGLQKNDIPRIKADSGNVIIDAISGLWEGVSGAFSPLVDICLATITLSKKAVYKITIQRDRNIFFYVVKGNIFVNGSEATMHDLVEFENDHPALRISASEESIILLGHAVPFNEPIVAQGPFVMNSEAEIQQAYADYQRGDFGRWNK